MKITVEAKIVIELVDPNHAMNRQVQQAPSEDEGDEIDEFLKEYTER